MSFRALKILTKVCHNRILSSSNRCLSATKVILYKNEELKTNTESLTYLDDPDKFGNLSNKRILGKLPQDPGDFKEEQYIQNAPLPSQKLTIKQYADLIKQYLKYKRLKEAIDVLEVRMITEDRVKPENYIYNILIGACADVGYTKKAFKLFNDMKKRALKPTGDTYTCLFNACANSPWSKDGLTRAHHLRELITEKSVQLNLTNYNSMIKAFGRCGDLSTAFQIVDEMKSKRIKIRVHTFNHLLSACISDKEHGLRHCLLVWRKMLQMREKPNIYSFNLVLKCVKECNVGSLNDMQEIIQEIQNEIKMHISKPSLIGNSDKLIDSSVNSNIVPENNTFKKEETASCNSDPNTIDAVISNTMNNSLQIVDSSKDLECKAEEYVIPNLLSKSPNMEKVLALREIETVQDRFALVGGQEDFIKEMQKYTVNPDIKTFTQMLMVLDDTLEAENKLMEQMKEFNLRPDIDFYNMLIKKRCLRLDYQAAFDVTKIIEEQNKIAKKKHPLKKKLILKHNIMTYGVLAMACRSKEEAEKLLNDMKEKKIKVNAEILGTLLRQGTARCLFGYIWYLMKVVKEDNLRVNNIFIQHLESFDDKCKTIIENESREGKDNTIFVKSYSNFKKFYKEWLQDVNIDEVLRKENPWAQFEQHQPDTFQRQNIVIKEPRRTYKRSRYYKPYMPRM